MDEFRKNEISYDEGWQTVTDNVVVAQESCANEEIDEGGLPDSYQKSEKQPKQPRQLLVTIQLFVCVVIVIAVFLLKSMGSDAYDRFLSWYNDEMTHTLISSEVFDNIDLSALLSKNVISATADNALSTIDEV